MERARLRGPSGARLSVPIVAVAIAVAAAVSLWPRPARAFEPAGHDIIEASAYRRILALDPVPGTGVSGRTLLAALIAGGSLVAPPCFDRSAPRGDCGPAARLEMPLAFWPWVGSGSADLIVNRQLNEEGQCQHFMAQTVDGLAPRDPTLGVPWGLATDAYRRCVRVLSTVYDGILRDPRRAGWHLLGMYSLMHAIEDSFSAAHAARGPDGRIDYLLSWTLIDWPAYFRRGRTAFPSDTHHAVSDARDKEYLRPGAVAPDGRPCDELFNPYAVPESCLSDRARAAVDAVTDLIVLTYRLYARAAGERRAASLTVAEDERAWKGFVAAHLAGAAVPADVRPLDYVLPSRPDVLIGVSASVLHGGGLGADLYGGRLFLGPAIPFALSLFGAAGYSRTDGVGEVHAGLELGLLLPLVRRFAIGVEPVGVTIACDTHIQGCAASTFATLGTLLIPVGRSAWLGALGPRWSWEQRALDGRWFGLAFGWAYEGLPALHVPSDADLLAWNPPRPDQVVAYRSARTSQLLYFAATAASTAENQAVGGGLEVRRDRDRWDRRAGWAPALGLEIAHGTIEGARGDTLGILPTLRAYVIPDRIAATVVPALVRVGTIDGHATGADVAGRVGVTLDLGRVEMEVDSPPLSYVSRSRWHTLPFSARIGLLFN